MYDRVCLPCSLLGAQMSLTGRQRFELAKGMIVSETSALSPLLEPFYMLHCYRAVSWMAIASLCLSDDPSDEESVVRCMDSPLINFQRAALPESLDDVTDLVMQIEVDWRPS
jgi:hypothetical protein